MTTKKYIPFASTIFTTTEKNKPITVNDNGDLVSTESIIVNSLKNSTESSKLELNNNEAKFTVAGKTCVINDTGITYDSKTLITSTEIPEIVNNLTTDDPTKCLSAAMGKALKDAYDNNIEGASGGLVVDGKNVKHSNVVSAKISQGLYKFAYDGNGHITGSSEDVIVDNLTTDDSGKVLSAKQGKKLEDSKVPFKWTVVEDGCILKIDPTDHVLKPVEFKIPFASITGEVSDNTKLSTALSNKLNKTDIDDSSESSVKLWSSEKVKEITDALSSVASIKVVETMPTTPEENTMYYVGTAVPYSVKLSAGGVVYDMGTTEVDLTEYVKKTDIVNSLTSEETTKALSAAQGKVLDQKITDSITTVVDSLDSLSTTDALSANQGRILNGKFLPLETGGYVKGNIYMQAGARLDTTTAGGYILTDDIACDKESLSIHMMDDNSFCVTLLANSVVGKCVVISSDAGTAPTLIARDSDISIMDENGDMDELKGVKAMFDMLYPVGSIYMNIGASLPTTFFGTWQKLNDGTFLCSANGDTEIGSTGGENSKTLTTNNLPYHGHLLQMNNTVCNSAGTHSHTKGTMRIYGKCNLYEYPGDKINNKSGCLMDSGKNGSNNAHTGHLANKRNGASIVINTDKDTSWTGITSFDGLHTHNITVSGTVMSTGGGQAFDNRPKYLAVSMWQRVA